MRMTKNAIYELLEQKMLSYRDYAEIGVAAKDDDEDVPFEAVREQGVIRVQPVNDSMSYLTNDEIYVRRPLVDLLYWAGQELKTLDRTLTLRVVYGYRALEVQSQLFEEAKSELAASYPDAESLIEAAHRRIAVPKVAGHPTGGAVDVDVLRDGEPVNMGTKIWEFSRDSFTFTPFVSREAWENRQLLRRAMMAAGFAPFDGEWWHFSYGDKEWARYYGKPHALFDQIRFDDARKVASGDRLQM
jgi:zinc D-Ala-D-Ala dipeptidase